MAEDIAKLKAARKILRQTVSKIINLLDSEIIKDQFDQNLIEENLFLLNSKIVELKAINEKILFCLKGDESDIEKERNSTIEYDERICLCVFRSNKKLSNVSINFVKEQSTHSHIADPKIEDKIC